MDDGHFSQLKARFKQWGQVIDIDWGHRLEIQDLTDSQIEGLADVLVDRLLDVGLRPDSEPNEFGLAIDDLIGKLYIVKRERVV